MLKHIKTAIPRIPKANFYLRLDATNTLGEHPIILYYIVNGEVAKITTGINVKEYEWDSKRCTIKISHPRHKQLNSFLQMKRHEFDSKILDAITKIGRVIIFNKITTFAYTIHLTMQIFYHGSSVLFPKFAVGNFTSYRAPLSATCTKFRLAISQSKSAAHYSETDCKMRVRV